MVYPLGTLETEEPSTTPSTHCLPPDSQTVFNRLLPSSPRQEKGETGDVSIEKDPDQVCLKGSLSWLHSLQVHAPASPFWLIGGSPGHCDQDSPTRGSHLTRKFPQQSPKLLKCHLFQGGLYSPHMWPEGKQHKNSSLPSC